MVKGANGGACGERSRRLTRGSRPLADVTCASAYQPPSHFACLAKGRNTALAGRCAIG